MTNHTLHTSESIADRLKAIQQQLATITGEPKLLAVSKTQSATHLREAYLAGQLCFGENYLQEALEKMHLLQDLSIEWHYIGPVQSNKCKAIAEHFQWVQSLDRIKIAEKLQAYCPAEKKLQVCIQVNVDREASKSGIYIDDIKDFSQQLSKFNKLKLRGLMMIPKATENIIEQRQSFAKLSACFQQLQNDYLQDKSQNNTKIDTLSMGMSKDYQVALEEGATMIRLGTALFGKRSK